MSQCCHMVRIDTHMLRYSQCARNATVCVKGKAYCWQHDPERGDERKAQKAAMWEAERERVRRRLQRADMSIYLAARVAALDINGTITNGLGWVDLKSKLVELQTYARSIPDIGREIEPVEAQRMGFR